MAVLKIIALTFAVSLVVEAQEPSVHKPKDISICDSTNNKTKIQCFCSQDSHNRDIIKSAECYPTQVHIEPDDENWNTFESLKNVTKLTLSNTRGFPLKYIPSKALQITRQLHKLTIKYGNIVTIEAFAFANLSKVEEITLTDNQVQFLAINAFAHLRDLSILVLDTNEITEINRGVFIGLPSLQKLYLTSNKITTIHDKAFTHLPNLLELEINRNNLFSLNSETFSGLSKLEKLDLSNNNLEVIGDNTFIPLNNLKILNLDSNKIEMLDEKAFHGLKNIYSLSLAHNKIKKIENVKIFENLHSLTRLSLKGNQLVELQAEVIAPILSNFYGSAGSLDVEDNNFPCECHLDWFVPIINKTQNSFLRLSIENLKCTPSSALKELWTKSADVEKTGEQEFDADNAAERNTEYEYYDEAQLDGKLFYIDIRHLANCTNENPQQFKNVAGEVTTTTKPTTLKVTTKTTTRLPPTTTTRLLQSTVVLPSSSAKTAISEEKTNSIANEKTKDGGKKANGFTTSPLATVSADPIPYNNMYQQDMASDEAKPEKIKAHRSIQDRHVPENQINRAHVSASSFMTVAIMLCLRLCFY